MSRSSKRSAASVSSVGIRCRCPAEPVPRLLRPARIEQRVGVGVEQPGRPRTQPPVGELGHLQGHRRGGGPSLVAADSRFDDPELDLDLAVKAADAGVVDDRQRPVRAGPAPARSRPSAADSRRARSADARYAASASAVGPAPGPVGGDPAGFAYHSHPGRQAPRGQRELVGLLGVLRQVGGHQPACHRVGRDRRAGCAVRPAPVDPAGPAETVSGTPAPPWHVSAPVRGPVPARPAPAAAHRCCLGRPVLPGLAAFLPAGPVPVAAGPDRPAARVLPAGPRARLGAPEAWGRLPPPWLARPAGPPGHVPPRRAPLAPFHAGLGRSTPSPVAPRRVPHRGGRSPRRSAPPGPEWPRPVDRAGRARVLPPCDPASAARVLDRCGRSSPPRPVSVPPAPGLVPGPSGSSAHPFRPLRPVSPRCGAR